MSELEAATGLPCTRVPSCCPDGLCCPAKIREGRRGCGFCGPLDQPLVCAGGCRVGDTGAANKDLVHPYSDRVWVCIRVY